ncbi:MAG: hypothetical protein EPO21_17035 [Chloroflexota bacterium]|nr:MAG: hypothetical protein EPO21_17035 [Chloroflexota bacterium]
MLVELVVWAIRALSLFNTIAFLWLGLAVLLNAERRTLGTWVAGGGLLMAGLFFGVHTTIVARDPGTLGAEFAFWWRAGWSLFIGSPYMWYVVIAWYTNVFRTRWHRSWLCALGLLGVGALAFAGSRTLLPDYDTLIYRAPVAIVSIAGVPIVVLVYSAYGVLCAALALAALRRPAASHRLMGDFGRRRARPWLMAASLLLLVMTVALGVVGAWLLHVLQLGPLVVFSPPTLTILNGIDLAVSALLGLTVILMGRAVVSYEVFTGKALPRGGLRRHWRNSLILAAGYGIVVGGSLSLPVDAIYRLLLATMLLVVFYALLSWRSFAEREQSIQRLRPFVASQRLYDHLLRTADPLDVDVAAPFRALCETVLGARVAHLAAMGPLAPLTGPPLTHPEGSPPPAAELQRLAGELQSSTAICLPVDPRRFEGAVWAVPLWSERGLIGVLLLGDKRDGGLYVQEEIEVARATGERLIDTKAGAEMARRLMTLQRRQLAESQVLDGQTRHVLHDDVLPRVHAAILTLSGSSTVGVEATEAMQMLADVHHRLSDLLRAMPASLAPDVAQLGLIGALRQVIEGELKGAFETVSWQIEPEAELAAQAVPLLVAEVTFRAAREAIRNAARHGRGEDVGRPLHLAITMARDDGLILTVVDNGVGLRAPAVNAGTGQGLVLHSTIMAVIGGTLSAMATPGMGTRVILTFPLSQEL